MYISKDSWYIPITIILQFKDFKPEIWNTFSERGVIMHLLQTHITPVEIMLIILSNAYILFIVKEHNRTKPIRIFF